MHNSGDRILKGKGGAGANESISAGRDLAFLVRLGSALRALRHRASRVGEERSSVGSQRVAWRESGAIRQRQPADSG